MLHFNQNNRIQFIMFAWWDFFCLVHVLEKMRYMIPIIFGLIWWTDAGILKRAKFHPDNQCNLIDWSCSLNLETNYCNSAVYTYQTLERALFFAGHYRAFRFSFFSFFSKYNLASSICISSTMFPDIFFSFYKKQ